jgi:hypothetical protein
MAGGMIRLCPAIYRPSGVCRLITIPEPETPPEASCSDSNLGHLFRGSEQGRLFVRIRLFIIASAVDLVCRTARLPVRNAAAVG